MRVLVTGAAGFIGRHLMKALHGHTVYGVDKRWDLSTADGPRLAKLVADWRPDVIVHLGAQCSTARSLADPAGDFVDNAVGTVNVAEAARRSGVPVVFTSTCKVQAGFDGRVAPLGMSKLVAEDYLRLYRREHDVYSVILRPSTVYGPGQDGTAESGWLTWFAKANLAGQRIEVAGDGSQSRDVLYIDDMVALLVDVVEHFDDYDDALRGTWAPVGGGPGNEVSLLAVLAELGHTDIGWVPRQPADLQRVVTRNELIGSVRGWAPKVGWRDGLARTRAWLQQEAVDG